MNGPASPPVASDAGVHSLTGSSPPGAGAPVFEPLAAAADPLPTAGSSIVDEAEALKTLIRTDDELWRQSPEDAADDDPRVVECRVSSDRVREASDALAERSASTAAEVGAKASVVLVGLGEKPKGWSESMSSHVHLIVSTMRDAVRLGTAERTLAFQTSADACLFDLIERHEAALVAADRASTAAALLYPALMKASPPRPAALYWQVHDGFDVGKASESAGDGKRRLFYEEQHVSKLREYEASLGPAPAPIKDAGMFESTFPKQDLRQRARLREIIEAQEAWEAQFKTLHDELGVTAAHAASDLAEVKVDALEGKVIITVPQTAAGWIAKARWLVDKDFGDAYLGSLALVMVRDMARLPAIRQLEFAGEPRAAVPDRRMLETYRTFLEFERRYVGAEMGLTKAQTGGFWLDNPSGRFDYHAPPPSTRAAAVLGMLGLMPASEDVEHPADEVAA